MEEGRPRGSTRVLDTLPVKEAPTRKAPPSPPPAAGDVMGRALRILFALGVVSTTAWFIYDRFFVLSTSTAVLAGRSVTLRSPIEGQLDMPPRLPGEQLTEGMLFATVINERADTRRLAELRSTVATLEGELQALEHRSSGTGGLLQSATGTAEAFRQTRSDQLRARLAEAEAIFRQAEARLREATTAATRGQSLVRQGFTTQAAMDVLRRDLDVARDTLRAAAERRDSLMVEQSGAAAGIFATDNATDRSVSQQTMDRLMLTLVEVDAMLAERRARLPSLREQLATEERLLGLNRDAGIRMPSTGIITRVLVQPGEYVRPGQEVARLVACGDPLLTAELEERTFRRIQLGQQAEFRPNGSRQLLRGEVIQLMPISLTPGEARTRPQVLLRIASEAGNCETGRMGELRFLR